MKLKYVIGISIASMLSLGSLAWMTQTEATELNTDFKIETISGDENVLRGFELSTITRSNHNEFSKVTFDGEEFSIEETIFDERHQLDGDQLANRELYRHMYFPSKFETDEYVITTEFDFRYTHSNTDPAARIAVKNRKTGEIRTEKLIFDEVSRREWVTGTHVIENEGNFYYILTTEGMDDGNSRAIIYHVNPDTLELQFEFEHQFENSSWGNFAVTNQFLYFIPSTNELGEEVELHSIHLETKEIDKKMISLDSWVWGMFGGSNFLIIETETDIYSYDEKQGELRKLEVPSFLEAVGSSDGGFTSHSSVVGNYFVVNYETHSDTGLNRRQYIAIYDVKTQELIYEGRIPLRNDQGLLSGFSVQLAQ